MHMLKQERMRSGKMFEVVLTIRRALVGKEMAFEGTFLQTRTMPPFSSG